MERAAQKPAIATAVVHPCSRDALLGAVEAAHENLIVPILVGPEAKIRAIADEHGIDISDYKIVDTPHSHASAAQAVALASKGEAEALMKGSLHTDEYMGAVLKKDAGLRTGRRISHVFAMVDPEYPKPFFITDAAMNIKPDLATKVDIAQNAIDLMRAISDVDIIPKVAVLSAVETVNPAIQSTIDAACLSKMADRGQITNAIVDGPLAFDNAISLEAAKIKGITSRVSGDADILLTPDLESGNMLAKQLVLLGGATSSGIIIGARIPIILTSRADGPEARIGSCAIAALMADARRNGRMPAL
ncbi:phosphate acetyltransferase [Martelella endophytica]|uniref:Phosphate acetyltransferase n=1 Tax=Martelella endophytica TaxID=1486262 RepID=A0A0D5LVD0_MAREN|nr:phosphate acetyltransferase [Martelella endophytica]